MAAETERDCRNGHRVDLSGVKIGLQTECPECKRLGLGRVPVRRRKHGPARPITPDDGGLAAAWAAETPLEPGSGLHPGDVSAKARARIAEQLAAIDKTAARRTAQLADPDAERVAAETLEAERAELLDVLSLFAGHFDTSDLPRDDHHAAARTAGVRIRGVLDHAYRPRVSGADTLDQLARARADLERYLDEIDAWGEAIADLRDDLDDANDHDDAIPGEVIADDQAPELTAAEYAGRLEQLEAMSRRLAGLVPSGLTSAVPAWPGAVPSVLPYSPCESCREARRRGPDHRWPAAAAEVEADGMAPAPVRVCDACLPVYRQRYGPALHVRSLRDYSPAYALHQRAATETTAASMRVARAAREREAAGRPLTGAEIMAIAGYGEYVPPVGARVRR